MATDLLLELPSQTMGQTVDDEHYIEIDSRLLDDLVPLDWAVNWQIHQGMMERSPFEEPAIDKILRDS